MRRAFALAIVLVGCSQPQPESVPAPPPSPKPTDRQTAQVQEPRTGYGGANTQPLPPTSAQVPDQSPPGSFTETPASKDPSIVGKWMLQGTAGMMRLDFRESGLLSAVLESPSGSVQLTGSYKQTGQRIAADIPFTDEARDLINRPDAAGISLTGRIQPDGTSVSMQDGRTMTRE